jgi:hypothetical protein
LNNKERKKKNVHAKSTSSNEYSMLMNLVSLGKQSLECERQFWMIACLEFYDSFWR